MMKNDTFAFMVDLLRAWLERARMSEIAGALELVSHELRRRGVTLRWETDQPLR